jgi:hypothetical protein
MVLSTLKFSRGERKVKRRNENERGVRRRKEKGEKTEKEKGKLQGRVQGWPMARTLNGTLGDNRQGGGEENGLTISLFME